jgi:hypothetical protein
MRRLFLLVPVLLISGCGGGHRHNSQGRFAKDLAIIRTVMPGDAYSDFYKKVNEARLSLEHVTRIEDGTVERYAFMDNSTAFVVVTVKGDRVREIVFEGIEVGASQPTK